MGYASKHWKHLSTCEDLDYCADYYIDPCLTQAKQALGMNRDKGNGYKQLILVQGEDSKVGELIYLLRGVVLMKFLSEILKKYTDLFQIVKISISSTDWLF